MAQMGAWSSLQQSSCHPTCEGTLASTTSISAFATDSHVHTLPSTVASLSAWCRGPSSPHSTMKLDKRLTSPCCNVYVGWQESAVSRG
jgi:hypothetical protein